MPLNLIYIAIYFMLSKRTPFPFMDLQPRPFQLTHLFMVQCSQTRVWQREPPFRLNNNIVDSSFQA